MKILVIGGMHGNEPLGISVVKLLQERPLNDVDSILANQQAIADNCRFIEQDLNRSFPGNAKSKVYEQYRAAVVLKVTTQYDIVLDFHNTHCPENDCGFVGETADDKLYDVVYLLGLKRIIVADYDCINKFANNCLSIEVSLDSQLNRSELWYERISMLSKLKEFKIKRKVEKYRFVYRMTLEDRDMLDLSSQNLQTFKAIKPSLAATLRVKSPAYPIFVNDQYTPYNYGGLLNKINV